MEQSSQLEPRSEMCATTGASNTLLEQVHWPQQNQQAGHYTLRDISDNPLTMHSSIFINSFLQLLLQALQIGVVCLQVHRLGASVLVVQVQAQLEGWRVGGQQ